MAEVGAAGWFGVLDTSKAFRPPASQADGGQLLSCAKKV